MLGDAFSKVERVLAAVTAMLLFTLNELRMLHTLPREADLGRGQTNAAAINVLGGSETVYLSSLDLAARWGLIGLILALSIWALSETFKRAPA
ncbi:MAG: hypothetical protein NW206_14895 [Hyphomonadaceae bacterium]|nr:hypothetical protein [Hyphomonadaceae bacterium]